MTFVKGRIPWNKGVKGIMSTPWNKGSKGVMKKNKTSFKKGKPPPKHKPNCKCFRCGGTLRKENHPNWKGGRVVHSSGYIFIHKPGHPFCNDFGYIFEHRVVVEKHINRFLTSKEVIHHRGKITDNRPHLLVAFSSNSAHIRFHKNPKNVKPSEIIFNGKNYFISKLRTSAVPADTIP